VTISAEQFWAQCIRRLEARGLSDQDINTWIRPLQPRLSGRRLLLLAPNRTVMERVRTGWLPEIQRALSQNGDVELTADIVVGSAPAPAAAAEQDAVAPAGMDRSNAAPAMQTGRLDPRHTFDTFIEGKSNKQARAAAQHVADSLASYNPLFIYGSSGLGKTHLMHGIGNAILASQPRTRVAYIGAEQWMNQFVAAIRNNRQDAFKNYYRTVDVLLIDDIHFFVGKESTQEEFFHTFNALVDNRKQIVLTSDRFPKELDGLDDRLKSRFSWGLTVSIEPPDLETRVAILLSKAEQMKFDLPDEVALFIAQRLRNHVRELEGALNTLRARVLFTREPVTMDLTRVTLKDMLASYDRLVTIENIMRKVSEYYNIRVADLSSKRRSRSLARPRQVAMALAKELTEHSLPEIGRAFDKDHTTVLHACKKVRELRDDDVRIREDYNNLLKQLSY
jgi:chromosomal replication initiator protein